MDIGSRIKKRREELGMTQDELAEKVGYRSRSSINKIEVDGRGLPQSKISEIAKALQTHPSYLMGWDMFDDSNKIRNLDITRGVCSDYSISLDFLEKYHAIDNKGKHTVNTVLEMEYNRCNKPHLEVNAAHAIDGASEEDKKHDDDIMDDDNF